VLKIRKGGIKTLIRRRKDRGNYIGLYLDKNQYDIVQAVSKATGQSVSMLIRLAIAVNIEPKYQELKSIGQVK
jgi:hypothetical protein